MNFHIRVRACALIIKENAVLLVEFDSKRNGLHYNLPAGGVEPGESVIEAVRREAMEEAGVDVEVGKLAFVYETAPHLVAGRKAVAGHHGISLMFECAIKEGSEPRMPEVPDEDQVGVRWVHLDELDNIVLYPNIKDHIKAYAEGKSGSMELLQEQHLTEQ
ncbi:NUDIX domain-containing protein [Fictibacillus aquaticus]|uniref:NUDIX hydrolase n=1 Tax=Fictibacillus aquaticus TaxID=2021314 RepID=A0A235F5S4_9BACL|nr:NUDIX domain-containing protein [Fictibacillus aquaticus]OYD56582.1 NUDIX hydrolase [Fictibacillus aquaticus]